MFIGVICISVCLFVCVVLLVRWQGVNPAVCAVCFWSVFVQLSDIASFSCFVRVLNGAVKLCLPWVPYRC